MLVIEFSISTLLTQHKVQDGITQVLVSEDVHKVVFVSMSDVKTEKVLIDRKG